MGRIAGNYPRISRTVSHQYDISTWCDYSPDSSNQDGRIGMNVLRTARTPAACRVLSATVAVWLVLLAGAVPGVARADGGDTTAVAINTRDGASIFRLAFQIRRVAGSVVDQQNAAVAFASCAECQTVAIAFQVVLAMGDVDTATPENYAIAINQDCTECTTLAAAYQFVLTTDGAVHFSAEGNQTLAELRRRLLELRDADLSPDEYLAELDAVAAELGRVLDEELELAGPPSASPSPSEAVSPSEGASPVAHSESPQATEESPEATEDTVTSETPSPAPTEEPSSQPEASPTE